MKLVRAISVSCVAVLLAAAPHAKAATLDSNSSTVVFTGYSTSLNTPTDTTSAATFNIGTGGGVWAGPVGTSSWVSFNSGTAPGSTYTPSAGQPAAVGGAAPDGTYTYQDTFAGTANESGSITVLADDTTSVILNGHVITPDAPATTAGKCTIGTPNCATEATYTLALGDFVNGTNTLVFGVDQDFLSATGLDFEGTVSATPEPSSIALLGTGLLSVAGVVRRRFNA